MSCVIVAALVGCADSIPIAAGSLAQPPGDAQLTVDTGKPLADGKTDANIAATAKVFLLDLPEPLTCPVGKPSTDAVGPDIPNFAKCIHNVPDDWPVGALAPDLLDAELGYRDELTGEQRTWSDGQWAPLIQGVQGTGHITADVLLYLPDQKGEILHVEVVRQVWYECDYYHESPTYKLALKPSLKKGWWAPVKALKSIVNKPLHVACGRWARFQTFVRLPAENHWHAAACTLRFFVPVPLPLDP
ncbi:MAG: hypothetical protein EXR77_07020 [Myxococcales bacterium]|nr:hypothetical protein [Myxococcales bacterium]